MPALDQLIPLYLTACTVEGTTDRTVQSYDETLRQFRRAGRELGLAEDVAAFGPAHVYLSGLPGALRATGEALVVRLAGGDKDSQERDTKGSGAGQWTVGGSSYGKGTQIKPWDPAERLETKEDMAAYLNVALEEGDLSLIIVTLGDIARARRMALVAQETGLGRESLYKSLSADGSPEFATVLKVVRALGLRLHATAAQGAIGEQDTQSWALP